MRRHPLFHHMTRLFVRAGLHRQGYDRSKINVMLDGTTDEMIDHTADDAKVGVADSEMVGAIGDGTILQKILDFLKSPEGQAFIKMLITLILAAFGI